MFHNSHLTKAQTSVPLYFKFGDGSKPPIARSFISQMDIFPSVIDYVSGSVPPFLEGNSLFRPSSYPYAVTARFNGGGTPYEFCINNGENKLIVQFEHRKQIAESKMLKVISLTTKDDERVHTDDVDQWIEDEFGPALKHLFPECLKAFPTCDSEPLHPIVFTPESASIKSAVTAGCLREL